MSLKVTNAINSYCETLQDAGFKTRIGASIIGDPCERKIWLNFRWTGKRQFDGRMIRLFERGELEEARFIRWLEGIGCEVQARGADGKQFAVECASGHGGSRMDGVVFLPEAWGIAEPLLFEGKTNGTGSGYNKICEDGFDKASAKHWAQACMVGFLAEIKHVLYIITNKNDDALEVQIKALDMKLGAEMVAKTERIKDAAEPPPRMNGARSKAFLACKMCDRKGVCWNDEQVEKNCRSCKFGIPCNEGVWQCAQHGGPIAKHVIPIGCKKYESIY